MEVYRPSFIIHLQEGGKKLPIFYHPKKWHSLFLKGREGGGKASHCIQKIILEKDVYFLR